MSSVSVVGIIVGSIFVSKKEEIGCSIDQSEEMTGIIMIGAGIVAGGVSIPFWTSAKKRKKRKR